MPIKFHCECGQRYSAKDSMAGKTSKCRKCGATLKIPELVSAVVASSSSLDDLLDADWNAIATAPPVAKQSAAVCPSCQAEMPANAVLCVSCGYHQTLGRNLENAVADKPAVKTGRLQGFLSNQLADGESAKSVFGLVGIGFAVMAALAVAALIRSLTIPLLVLGGITFFIFMSSRHRRRYGGGYGGSCSGGYHSSCSGGYHSSCSGGWFSSCGGGGDGGGDGGGGCGGCGGGGGE